VNKSELSQKINPVHLGHVIIGDDNHDIVILKVSKGIRAVITKINREISGIFKIHLEEGTKFPVIIDEENLNHSQHPAKLLLNSCTILAETGSNYQDNI
jgi:hypothetical protein